METYTTEEEQIARIKKWWGENGKAIIFGLVIGLGGIFGYRYWESAQIAQGQSASINYEHLLALASGGASEEVTNAGQAIIDGYPKTTYAKLSALVLAKLAVDVRDLAEAKERLNWIVSNAKGGKILPVALSRLARIHLAEGNAAEAAAAIAKINASYADQFIELRGDVLLAEGKTEDALAMYERALSDIRERGSSANALQLKIDNIALANR